MTLTTIAWLKANFSIIRLPFAMVACSRRAWVAWILLLARRGIAWSAPLIVDTDMNQDDMAALVYLIRSGADIKGITVSANGFSAQRLRLHFACAAVTAVNTEGCACATGFIKACLLSVGICCVTRKSFCVGP